MLDTSNQQKRTAVVICSGGLDSTVLAYLLRSQGYELTVLSFDYGQRHKKELRFASATAQALKAEFIMLDIAGALGRLGGSALTDLEIDVPHGHYESETMKATVVPNRNAIMLSFAWALAITRGAQRVAYGAHGGDHHIYADCRPEFVAAIEFALHLGNEGFGDPKLTLYAPFLNRTKADIVSRGVQLGVDFKRTWSCYEGGAVHCGKCGTCVERIEAFERAGVKDPTLYSLNLTGKDDVDV